MNDEIKIIKYKRMQIVRVFVSMAILKIAKLSNFAHLTAYPYPSFKLFARSPIAAIPSRNRWGRVGEPGQNKLEPFGLDRNGAIASFKKKFKDKTGNNWDERDHFQKVEGKYDMVDMEADEEEQEEAKPVKVTTNDGGPPKKVLPCKLPEQTAKLVKLLFDHDMFREAMASMEIDVQKMPLGKISKAQLAKGCVGERSSSSLLF